MNFISHFRGVMYRFAHDHRPSQAHVALYVALFHQWNLCRFQVPMHVARDDIMRVACMTVPRIFYRCINDLDHWGYLKYEASFDPNRASLVRMIRFDRGKAVSGEPESDGEKDEVSAQVSDGVSDQVSDEVSDEVSAQVREEVSDQVSDQVLFNSIINDKNDLNDKNKPNELNDYEHTHNSNHVDDWQQPGKKTNYSGAGAGRQSGNGNTYAKGAEKACEKKGEQRGAGGAPSSLEEIEAYFAEQKFGSEQAQRFFNYYSNLGWRIGAAGRPMEDWRYAAQNWMLNIKKFDHEPDLKPGAIHIPADRDYQQPL